MPDSFAETPEGLLFIADGMDRVLRWDGLTAQAEIAGVAATDTKPVLSSSGVGSILGTYYAYVRFVDRLGNLSNLSPISASLTTNGRTGIVTGATKATPIVITSAAHGLTTGTIVKVSSVRGNSDANGTWTITVVDANSFKLNGSSGSRSYESGSGTWIAGASTVTYSSVAAPSERPITKRQLLRNTDGQTQTFYVDIDTTDLTSSTLSSSRTDTDLSAQTAAPLLDSDTLADLAIKRYTRAPNHKTVLAHVLGRMFAAVEIEYSEGCLEVTFGSTAVTGIGTEWTKRIAGRSLYVSGSDKVYTISDVTEPDVAAQTLTLTESFLGTTDKYVPYTIRSAPAEKRLVYYSESGLPEAWPPTNAFSVPEDGDEITGLMPMNSYLYVLERQHAYRFSFLKNPASDGSLFLAADRGCINNRCWVKVEDAAYMLDADGIHKFAGGQSDPISAPIRGIFSAESDAPYQINWRASRYFHAAHFSTDEVIRWFVALSGEYLPQHAICYDYRQDRWWVEQYAVPIGASCNAIINGRPRVLLGGRAKRVYAFGEGQLDGPDPNAGTTQGTATSAGLLTLAQSTATYASAGLVGSPVVITGGKGKGQLRVVTAVSGTTLTLDRPWLDIPDTTSTYQLGGMAWKYRTGWFEFADAEFDNQRRVEAVFSPTVVTASMDLKLYIDHVASPVSAAYSYDDGRTSTTARQPARTIDLTTGDGFCRHDFSGGKDPESYGPRYVSVELSGIGVSEPITVYQLNILGVRGG